MPSPRSRRHPAPPPSPPVCSCSPRPYSAAASSSSASAARPPLPLPRLNGASNTELSQMMVDVFVHQNRPLLWLKRTEERMWVLGAARRAFLGEAIDRRDETPAFLFEIAPGGVRRK